MFGLIGERLDYSLSKNIHEAIRPMTYNLIPLNGDEFHRFMERKGFKGINVTIPYKEAVIPYLNVIDEAAKKIGAVNTIINKDGVLYGYNTDLYGFEALLDKLSFDLEGKNVLILGTGGSSKTAYYALEKRKVALIEKASRSKKEGSLSYDDIKGKPYDLIINTTPIGTSPNNYDSPVNLDDFPDLKGVIDLVYNPPVTAFLKQGQIKAIDAIGGIDMLYIQAIYANDLFAPLMEEYRQDYYTVYPSKVSGCVKLPCSKSLAHRGIICASLGNCTSQLSNISMSDDIKATASAMEKLGAKLSYSDKLLEIKPIDYANLPTDVTIDCLESGTTLRLLIPIISALGIDACYVGSSKLFERPLDAYEEIFTKQGINFELGKTSLKIKGQLKSDTFVLENLKSSQFASGILLALPLLKRENSTVPLSQSESSHLVYLKIEDKLESASYLNLTVDVMRAFGIDVQVNNNEFSTIKSYKAQNYYVEIDYSQLAFFAVLGAINSKLSFECISKNTTQGDKVILSILESMGAKLTYEDDILTVEPRELKAITIDVSNCPDLVPILMVLACFASGKTIIQNTHRLKYKESPRDSAMAVELEKLGIKADILANSIVIEGKQKSNGGKIHSHNDHRIVMALSILALSSEHPIEINNHMAVAKSFPNFFEVINEIIK